jgi:hypothetical protein
MNIQIFILVKRLRRGSLRACRGRIYLATENTQKSHESGSFAMTVHHCYFAPGAYSKSFYPRGDAMIQETVEKASRINI